MHLFFIRDFNDIDHMTPVVWKMKQGNYSVAVYCLNPDYNIQDDYRLNFLRKTGVHVDFIYDACLDHLNAFHRMIRMWHRQCVFCRTAVKPNNLTPSSYLRQTISRLFQKAAASLFKLSLRRIYTIGWAQKFLEQSQAQVLCFDWIRPHKYAVKPLLHAAKSLGIPTVALPHGVFLYTNDVVQTGLKKDGQFDRYAHFDHVVVQNRLFKEKIVSAGIPGEKIGVLGSARYCKEWIALNNKILPRATHLPPGDSEKLKAIFMTTRPHYRIDIERMLKTFRIVADIEGLEVMVKPHTRSGKEAVIYENQPLPNVADVSSVELCEWADVTLVIASSIIIESLLRRKPVLYLKYLHQNTTEYEKLGACWTIHSEAELRQALISLKTGTVDIPYTEEDINRWLSEIIYGGRNERDVLKDYTNFILNCAV
jgi:hypothetical protein